MKLFLVNAFAWMMSLVPPRIAWLLAWPLAGLIWLLSRRLRTVSLVNIALCYPDESAAMHRRLAREAMVNYVRSGMETGIAWFWSRPRIEGLFLEPEGMEIIDAARSEGRGVVLLCPHIAAWEMLGLSISDIIDGAALYKPGTDSAIEAQLVEKRQRFGAHLVPANRSGLKVLFECLRERKVVAILPDQEPKLGAGVFAPFFGVPALTGVLAHRMISKTGARVVFAAGMRCPKGRYRVHFVAAREEIYADNPEVSAAAINQGVEDIIALGREQYLWAYKRFRTRPEGEPRLY